MIVPISPPALDALLVFVYRSHMDEWDEIFEAHARLCQQFPSRSERLLVSLARYQVAAEGKDWPPLPDCMSKILDMIRAEEGLPPLS